MVLVLQWLHVHNADGLEGGSPAICFRPPGHQKVDTFRYLPKCREIDNKTKNGVKQ